MVRFRPAAYHDGPQPARQCRIGATASRSLSVTRRDAGEQRTASLRRRARQAAWLHRVRPTLLATPVLKLLRDRQIFACEGIRLFLDPTTHLGQEVLRNGTYEPETVAMLRDRLRPGDVVLDIGANEGFFAALAATLVGETGRVIAVEPQSRLQDVLAINLALNRGGRTDIVQGVVSDTADQAIDIHLFPISNSGATSIVKRYSLGARSETTRSWTPQTLATHFGLDGFDLVKVDVEGFEPEVAEGLYPLLERGAVRTLLLDYHDAILKRRGLDGWAVHSRILAAGMVAQKGSVGHGYVLYDHRDALDPGNDEPGHRP